jgi:2-iminobutanoate/2-iminopropanoate deaminase
VTEFIVADTAGISTPNSFYPSYVRHGDLVYVSGQVSFDDTGGIVGIDDVALQTETALDRLARVLADAGSDLSHVVTATAYLTSASYAAAFNEVWRRRFGNHRPARATVVADLLDDRLLVEISATAVVSSGTAQ